MICVTTRFKTKSLFGMLRLIRAYWRMKRDLHGYSGLLRFALYFEGPHTCLTLSIWESERAIVTLSNMQAHLAAVRLSKGECREIWSAYWRLDNISATAMDWKSESPVLDRTHWNSIARGRRS